MLVDPVHPLCYLITMNGLKAKLKFGILDIKTLCLVASYKIKACRMKNQNPLD